MRHRQRGVTFLGWVFLLVPMALVLYAVIRLTPVYLEYMKIARTLEKVQQEFHGDQVDAASIRTTIEKHFDIESVGVMSVRDTDKLKITREGNGYTVQAVYSDKAPFLGNISLRVDFDKTVKIE